MADDYNSMQANMGLVGSGMNNFSPVGIPTPMVRHPGELSYAAVQQAQSIAYATRQSGVTPPLLGFAKQYQNNMSAIQSQHLNPFVAQSMAQMGNFPGFNTSMLPSPTSVTPASMGIFRSFPQAPGPIIPPTPMMPFSMAPALPPQFHSPYEYSLAHGYHRGMQVNSVRQSLPGVAARAAVGYGAGKIGAGIGASIGAALGGPPGAVIGGGLGMAAGYLGAEYSGLGEAAQGIVNRVNPFRPLAQRAAQMKGISNDFIIGGAGLDPSGRGLSSRSSMHLGRMLEDIGYDSSFRKETNNMFTMQDLTRITRLAGEQGMLDMAQKPEQVVKNVKHITKALKSIMQIAGEPDVAEAMKMLGTMHTMGMSISESSQLMQNARLYAKMAGTNVRELIQTAGNQGALLFQQQGLSAGLGLQVGMGSFGLARQAVAGGTFTPQQLAMLGGTQGIAQRDMESSAAMLKMPMMTAAMSGRGAGGTFGLNGNNVQAMMSGKRDINKMAGMGADNLLSAVQRHGVGALGMFQAQQEEIQDQLGRALGPMGLKSMKMRQVMATQKMLGLSGPGGFVTAAQAMGMDSKSAMQLMREANSPEFFQNVQRQFDVQRQELRYQSDVDREATDPGFISDMSEHNGFVRGARDTFRGMGVTGRNFIEGTNNFLTGMGEQNEAWKTGRFVSHAPRSLLTSGSEARMVAALSRGEIDRFKNGMLTDERLDNVGTAPLFTLGGRGYGRNRVSGWMLDRAGGDPNALAEVMRAEGGFTGMLGGNRAGVGLAVNSNLIFGGSEQETFKKAESFRQASQSLLKAKGASVSEETGALKKITSKFGDDKGSALATLFTQKIADAARSKSAGWKGLLGAKGGALNRDDQKKALREAAVELGIDHNSVDLDDLVTATTKDSEFLAGGHGRDAFRMPSMEIAGVALKQGDTDSLLQAQESIATKVFGDNGWLETNEDRTDALSQMFGKTRDPRVSIVASLMEAAQSGEEGAQDRLNQFLNGLPVDERQEILSQARQMAKGANDQQKSYLRRAGVGMKKTTSNKELMSQFDKLQSGFLASKRLYQDWGGQKTDSKVVGGDLAEGERGLDKQANDFKSLQGEMAQNFPDAVRTFDEAARLLLDAAVRLGNRNPTAYDAEVN
jgi:hypothetical protein